MPELKVMAVVDGDPYTKKSWGNWRYLRIGLASYPMTDLSSADGICQEDVYQFIISWN